MLLGITTFLAGLFSSTKMQDTAIDAVRKLGGLDDLNHKEKAQFLLDYMRETKHQSPVRRLIALLLTFAYVSVIIVWLVSAGSGYLLNYVPAMEYAGAVKLFMESTLTQPFNIILSFYFVMNIASKLGGK